MKVLFRAPVARAQISIRVPVYPSIFVNGEPFVDTSRDPVGTMDYVYSFIEGQGFNELTLDTDDDPQKVQMLREYIVDNPEYQEVSCDKPPEETPVQHKVDRSTEWDEQYSKMLRR